MKRTLWNFAFVVLILAFCVPNSFADVIHRKFTLVIDPGHGGHDPGAMGAFSREKDINLNVALAFGRLVEANCKDVKVIYTRKTDVFIPLQRRADIANNAKADLFISIHTNALPKGRYAYGSETYTLGMHRAKSNLEVAKRENSVITLENDYQHTYKGFDPNKAESYVIFEIMQDRYMKQSVDLACCIQKQYTASGRKNKGVHQAGFLVLRQTSMPSVLTELGFVTTPGEERYLNSKDGINALARSLYNGLLSYRRQHDKTANDLPENLPAIAANVPSVAHEVPKAAAVVPVKVTKDSENDNKDSVSERHAPHKELALEVPQKAVTARQKTEERRRTATTRVQKSSSEKQTAAKSRTKTGRSQKAAPRKPAGPKISYRIQVGAGKATISPKDPQFKKLPINRVKEGSLFKYFYGNYTTYADAKRGLQKAKAKIPGAYIVAYVDGRPVSVTAAREKERKK